MMSVVFSLFMRSGRSFCCGQQEPSGQYGYDEENHVYDYGFKIILHDGVESISDKARERKFGVKILHPGNIKSIDKKKKSKENPNHLVSIFHEHAGSDLKNERIPDRGCEKEYNPANHAEQHA